MLSQNACALSHRQLISLAHRMRSSGEQKSRIGNARRQEVPEQACPYLLMCVDRIGVAAWGELSVRASDGVHWRLTWCCLLLQGCGHQAAGNCDIGAAVGAGTVVLPVLCGGLPPAHHPQGLPPAARALCIPQAAPALRAPPGRAQDLNRLLCRTFSRQPRSANNQGQPLRPFLCQGSAAHCVPLWYSWGLNKLTC